MYYLGIDLGTSSVKGVLADINGIIHSETFSYPVYTPYENYSEQDPSDWWDGVKKVIKKIAESYDLKKELSAISFCGQMHGLVLLDNKDEIIRNAILWNDQRTIKECDYINSSIGKEKLIEYTGNICFTGFTAPKILWVKNNEGDNFNRISKIMLPKDYISYKLSGVFASDVSDNSGTLYFDVKNRCWAKEILNVLSIKENQLPKIYESYCCVGKILQNVAEELNVNENTKIVIGGGDQAVGAIGTNTVKEGELSISLGTSGVVFAPSDKYTFHKEGIMHSFRHANGKFHSMGCMLSCAASLDYWVKEIQKETFDSILSEIDNLPISDVLFLPYLTGERSPINDPYAKGGFLGITATTTRGDMTKAVIEGASFGLYDCLLALREMGIDGKSAKVIGGGAKSKQWLQILADIMGITLHTINTTDGGCLGAIILAMTADGVFKCVEEGCEKMIKTVDEYNPNMENHSIYKEKFKRFKNFYNATKNI